MARKISYETELLIQELYCQDLFIEEIAKRTHVTYATIWKHTKAKNKYGSPREYEEHLVKKRGFASMRNYRIYLAKQRQKNPENKKLSSLIRERLRKIKKSRSWLARQLGVSREAGSKYAKGEMIPNEDRLRNLFEVLGTPYKTLDDLLADA